MEKEIENKIIEHIIVQDKKDSLDIGTAGRNGNIKVYYNANNLEEAKRLVDNAIKLREYANEQLNKE